MAERGKGRKRDRVKRLAEAQESVQKLRREILRIVRADRIAVDTNLNLLNSRRDDLLHAEATVEELEADLGTGA